MAVASVAVDLGQPDRGAGGGEDADEQRADADGDEPAEEGGAPVDAAELLALARARDVARSRRGWPRAARPLDAAVRVARRRGLASARSSCAAARRRAVSVVAAGRATAVAVPSPCRVAVVSVRLNRSNMLVPPSMVSIIVGMSTCARRAKPAASAAFTAIAVPVSTR